MEQTHLSHDQLRRIMAEIVDKELLHYIEARRIYIRTIKDTYFLKKEIRANLFSYSCAL